MREMVRTVAVHPLGVHGEGLFQYLKQTKTRNLFPIINEGLKMLDWFEDVSPADETVISVFCTIIFAIAFIYSCPTIVIAHLVLSFLLFDCKFTSFSRIIQESIKDLK